MLGNSRSVQFKKPSCWWLLSCWYWQMVKCLNPNVDDLCLHWQVVRCLNPHVADCCCVDTDIGRWWDAWTVMSMTVVMLTPTGAEMPDLNPHDDDCCHFDTDTVTGDEMPELSCRWLLCFHGQVVGGLNPHVADCCRVDTDRWWDALTHMLMIFDCCCVDTDRWWDAWTLMSMTVVILTLTGGEMPEPTWQWLLSWWHLQVWNAWTLCWWLLSCWLWQVVRCLNHRADDCCRVDSDRWWNAWTAWRDCAQARRNTATCVSCSHCPSCLTMSTTRTGIPATPVSSASRTFCHSLRSSCPS